jgi:type I restriction enzyme M protein
LNRSAVRLRPLPLRPVPALFVDVEGAPLRIDEPIETNAEPGHVQDANRLALMNLMLHGIDSTPDGAGIRCGDTLSPDGKRLPKATLIVTNPSFGTKKGGGLPTRTDFTFPPSNKQFCFLQHVYRGLKSGGRPSSCPTTCCARETSAGRSAPT